MESCPNCDRQVERLHPVHPGAFNKELLTALDAQTPADLELCGECVNGLA